MRDSARSSNIAQGAAESVAPINWASALPLVGVSQRDGDLESQEKEDRGIEGTCLILWEIGKPFRIIMSSQDYPSRSSRVERINEIRELDFSNRCRVFECVLPDQLLFIRGDIWGKGLTLSSCHPRFVNIDDM